MHSRNLKQEVVKLFISSSFLVVNFWRISSTLGICISSVGKVLVKANPRLCSLGADELLAQVAAVIDLMV